MAASNTTISFAARAGAIGGFAGPYVVGALVDTRGGYVTCMQVLGGLFLVQSAMIICEPTTSFWQPSLSRLHRKAVLVARMH